ncbi:MAG: ABC transporter permease [Bacteroidia bacterium]|nr:ABC transporter permease [Bacteroidia bacterium]
MRKEWFIARRLIKGADERGLLARPAVRIAVITLTLGMAAMALSVMIVGGFKKSITEKLTGFTAHIQLSSFDLTSSFESKPIELDSTFIKDSKKLEGIRAVYPYCNKNGIIKTENDVQGVVLKGYDTTFLNPVFLKSIVKGTFEQHPGKNTNPIVLSTRLASLLNKKVGDHLFIYFIQNPPRVRKMTITGLYDSVMEEFDHVYAFSSMGLFQQLNGWGKNQYSGYEIETVDFRKSTEIKSQLEGIVSPTWKVETTAELFPQIFSWLELINVNAIIIITLIVIVAITNLVITLLILILEQIFFIGVMKAMGSAETMIKRIFMLMAGYVLITGLIMGNVLAVLFAFFQQKYNWITLPEDSYYMTSMPMSIDFLQLLMLNAGVIVITMLVLIIPSVIIKRINPIVAIKFD